MAEPMISARDFYVRGTDDPVCESDSDWFHFAEQYAEYVTAARDAEIAALTTPNKRRFPVAKIIVQPVFPPIPTNAFDWCAYYDGEEESGNYGWGATEADAVCSLQDGKEVPRE